MKNYALGNIMRISRCCNTYRKEQLKDVDLTPAQYIFISYACRKPGSSQEQFVSAISIDKTTVAHRLNKLEEMGYIERRVSAEDGRRRCIYPTEKALAIYPQIHSAYEYFTENILEGLTEEDKAELTRLTNILCQNAIQLTQETRSGG